MKRKIVRHGPSSLTMSLPIAWAKKYELEPGDEVEVLEEGPTLVISGKSRHKSKEASIEIKEPLMKRLMVIPYIQGYDLIRYTFNTAKEMKFIENHIDLMYGFEIIKETPTSITVKNIATIKEDEFNNMVTRLFHVCHHMFEVMEELLTKKDKELIHRLESLEKSLNKIDLFCRRLINMESFYKTNKGSRYAMIRLVETIGDHLMTMANYIDDMKTKDPKAVQVFRDLKEAFKLLEKIYFARKIDALFEFKKMEGRLWKEIHSDMGQKSNTFLLLNLKGLYYYIHDLSEELFFKITT